MTVNAVAERVVMAGSEVWRSSETTQVGVVANPPLANVRVQAVGDALPTLIVPAKFVAPLSMLGEVPQEETVGNVPLDMTFPLF